MNNAHFKKLTKKKAKQVFAQKREERSSLSKEKIKKFAEKA